MTRYLLTLLICVYFALAPVLANAVVGSSTPQAVNLQIQRIDEAFADSARLVKNWEPGGVAVEAQKTYPIAVRATQTIDGVATVKESTLTATQTTVKKVMPTAGQVAKGLGRSVGVGLVTLAIYDLLGKAVDYVLDPDNNQVKFKESSSDGVYWVWSAIDSSSPFYARYVDTTPARACQNIASLYGVTFDHVVLTTKTSADCYDKTRYYNAVRAVNYEPIPRVMSYDEVAQRGIKLANNGNTSAQNSLVETVNDMSSNPTTYNIDNSYFDGGTVINDNSDEIINNYITNNYPNVVANMNKSDGTVTNSDGSISTTTTKDNGDGTSTQTTVTNNTTNNTSSTTNTTYNNTTNNITNISYVTNITNINEQPATASTPAATASSPASTTASTPASATGSTELPAFCDWAKTVCDFIDWVKKDPPEEEPPKPVPHGGLSDVGLDGIDRYEMRIVFPHECPSQTLELNLFGRTYSKQIPYQYLCQFLEMVAPFFVAISSLGIAFYIVREV